MLLVPEFIFDLVYMLHLKDAKGIISKMVLQLLMLLLCQADILWCYDLSQDQ